MDNAFLEYVCNIVADTNNGLTGSEIIKYCNKYAIEYNISIPVDNIEMLKTTHKDFISNKRIALKKNLEVFSLEQQLEIIKFLCSLPKFSSNNEIGELLIKMNLRFKNYNNQELNKNINETKHWLSNYPKSLKLYNEALQKYEQGIYQRNILDDMRLSLELLLKTLLNNEKSLENQFQLIGKEFKNKSVSTEVTHLFNKLLTYYSDYQNHYIKHNDIVKTNEIELLINQTNTLMIFLIQTLG